MRTFAIYILGCKVNHYEATYVKEKLIENGLIEVNFNDKADIYLIFTCCVTNVAESKTRKYIHRAKRNNPDAYIGVIGCLSQLKPNDFNEYDLIIGSNNKEEIVNYVLENKKANLVKKEIDDKFDNLTLNSYPDRSRAFLKIQDGCNQYCTFCIIPYSRGKERSKNHNLIIEEAKVLLNEVNEIVLTGIHTGRYNDGEYNLYDLLNELLKLDNLKTIRLSSIEINEISDELIELFKNPKFGKNIHIPVQSLSDEILKLMHRPYDYKYYKERIDYIRKEIPDISISTDLIVGFPQESDELFDITYNRLKEIKFSFIHVFPYSRKKDTVADKYDGHLNKNIKKERVNKVIKLSKDISNEYHKSFINKEVEILIEKYDDHYSYGYSKQYFYCQIKGKYNIGDIIKVKIIEIINDKIICEYVS